MFRGEAHQLTAPYEPLNMFHRLIAALVALIVQTNASFIQSEITQSVSTSGNEDYFLNGFDIFLKQSFFESYPKAKSIHFINCNIIFEEDSDENGDFWDEESNHFPLERLSFKNCSISRPKWMDYSEPFGNGVQDRLRNFKEILYESCFFSDGIGGPIFFVNSATLTHLKIIDCDVASFKFDSFRSLQNLQHVEIKDSNILVDPNMFSRNRKLRYLDIPWNQFEALLSDDFPTSLEYLDISGYNSMIVCVTLRGLDQLKYLNMSHSKNLILTNDDCFPKNLRILEVLDFSWNHVKFLTNSFVAGMRKLKELHLNDNEMIFIDQKAFKDLINLEILDLRNNYLVSIKELVFVDLISLRYLYVMNNIVATRTSECFRNRAGLEDGYKNDSCLDRFGSLKGVYIAL